MRFRAKLVRLLYVIGLHAVQVGNNWMGGCNKKQYYNHKDQPSLYCMQLNKF